MLRRKNSVLGMQNNNKHILILGGGTAGWMTASYLAKKLDSDIHSITLVESPDIGIIGVGEGSTPSLKNFMDEIGVAESDWMPSCNATYKVGITFKNWSIKKGFSQYCHPFPSELDAFSSHPFALNCHLKRHSCDVDAHPDRFFLQSYLANHNLAPLSDENFPFTNFYGYHFDSGMLGQFLASYSKGLGVRHLQANVSDVELSDNGNIAAIILEDGQKCEADLFIDCSGFRSILLQKSLDVPFNSFKQNLFNDSAVVAATERTAPLQSQTISTALSAGWVWQIPLLHRTGNGYVYSSDYISDQDAESEFRNHLGLDEKTETRTLKFNVGRVANHWHKNCVAVGLSQGFIEPLEATALHLVHATIAEFATQWQEGQYSEDNIQQFNQRINARFDGVRDYIVAHYRLASRNDSEYWRDCQKNNHLSESLVRILQAWTGALPHDIDQEINQQKIADIFPVNSWRILLAGYGFFPDAEETKAAKGTYQSADMEKQARWLQGCGLNYTTQQAMLSGSD